METFKTAEELRMAIQKLEYEQLNTRVLLKEQILVICETLKPVNIVKDTIKEFSSDPEVKTGLFNNAAGWIVGLLTRKLFVGGSNSLLRKLAGNAIERLVANGVARNGDKLMGFAEKILDKVAGESEPTYKTE